ncbi:hypothetical protein, partial [Viscerimonas tarda]
WMAKKDFKRLECTGTGISAYTSKGEKEEMSWSGCLEPEGRSVRALYRYPDKKGFIGNYPDWRSVIPTDAQYAACMGIAETAFDADSLSATIECFAFGKEERAALKFEFSQAERINLVRITPLYDGYGITGKQCVYLIPREIND